MLERACARVEAPILAGAEGAANPPGQRRYLTIVKLSDAGADRAPVELVAVITSV
jgi:hypothetical protein